MNYFQDIRYELCFVTTCLYIDHYLPYELLHIKSTVILKCVYSLELGFSCMRHYYTCLMT